MFARQPLVFRPIWLPAFPTVPLIPPRILDTTACWCCLVTNWNKLTRTTLVDVPTRTVVESHNHGTPMKVGRGWKSTSGQIITTRKKRDTDDKKNDECNFFGWKNVEIFYLNLNLDLNWLRWKTHLLIVIKWNRYSTAHQIGNFTGIRDANKIAELILFDWFQFAIAVVIFVVEFREWVGDFHWPMTTFGQSISVLFTTPALWIHEKNAKKKHSIRKIDGRDLESRISRTQLRYI